MNQILEKVSIQRCDAENDLDFDRIGSKPALYAFVYPNFIISRYGPWMDTNLVLPQGPRKCLVIFDYFLDSSHKVRKHSTQYMLSYSFKIVNFIFFAYRVMRVLSHRVSRIVRQCRYSFNFCHWHVQFSRVCNLYVRIHTRKAHYIWQIEDMKLCEAVQRGLESPAYCSGRYVPQVEKAVHHFHSLLYESLSNWSTSLHW